MCYLNIPQLSITGRGLSGEQFLFQSGEIRLTRQIVRRQIRHTMSTITWASGGWLAICSTRSSKRRGLTRLPILSIRSSFVVDSNPGVSAFYIRYRASISTKVFIPGAMSSAMPSALSESNAILTGTVCGGLINANSAGNKAIRPALPCAAGAIFTTSPWNVRCLIASILIVTL